VSTPELYPDGLLCDRINPGLPPDELAAALAAVQTHFGIKWLKGHSAHPLRSLWARTDVLATCELFWLGHSLRLFEPIDARWLAGTVERMQDTHRNSRVGHAFELLLGATFVNDNQIVTPAPPNNPDYDLDVDVHDGPNLRLSFKNFGTTPREDAFKVRCHDLEDAILRWAEGRSLTWVGIAIECERYPLDGEWRLLDDIMSKLSKNRDRFKTGPWTVSTIASPVPLDRLERSRVSMNFFVLAPHHPNERNNFLDKIHRESVKFNKASARYDPRFSSGVLFRLSETAPFNSYVEWGREYLAREDVLIKSLWFYQSAIVQTKNNHTALHHHMNASHQALPGKPPALQFIVGIVSPTPARDELHAGPSRLPLSGYHWYQRHDLFDIQPGALDGATVHMNAQPGITRHGVMGLPGGATIILSPKQPSFDYVALFT